MYISFFQILESNKVCVKYDTSLSSFQKSGKVQDVYKNYSDDLKYISNKTEWNVTDLTKPSILYGILSRQVIMRKYRQSHTYFNLFQEEWHLKLPNWTDVVYPETLYKMASKNYLILSGSTELKQIGSGFFLTFTSVELVLIVTFKVICFKKLFMTHS
jgi:hypothetical protein